MRDRLRPVDLAREHGLSAQAVRNYERDGVLPAAERTINGYRVYTPHHASALRAYIALVAAHGYGAAAEVMRAVDRGELDGALRIIDRSHDQLRRDRETLDAVDAAVGPLAAAAVADRPNHCLMIGQLARRLGVVPATLRQWERIGILVPERDRATGYRLYTTEDARDAELAHLLRRGGYPLAHIATVIDQVRSAGGPEPLTASLEDWRQRLTTRGCAMLTAAGRLADHLRSHTSGSMETRALSR